MKAHEDVRLSHSAARADLAGAGPAHHPVHRLANRRRRRSVSRVSISLSRAGAVGMSATTWAPNFRRPVTPKRLEDGYGVDPPHAGAALTQRNVALDPPGERPDFLLGVRRPPSLNSGPGVPLCNDGGDLIATCRA